MLKLNEILFYNLKMYLDRILNLSLKKCILILWDIFSIAFSINISLYIISDIFWISSYANYTYIAISITILILIYCFTGQYKSITRYFCSKEVYNIITRCVVGQFFIALTFLLTNLNFPSLKLMLLSTLITFLFLAGSRFVIRDIIYLIRGKNIRKRRKYSIAIYGAGEAGFMLLSSLQNSKYYSVKYFFDDDFSKNGRFIKGVEVVSSSNISKYIDNLDKIFLAIPSLKFSEKKNILNLLSEYRIEVLQIPSIEEISKGKLRVDNLKKINIKDLLDRKEKKIKSHSNYKLLKEKTILVTGAGGSIGRELCNQILKYSPSKIILLDNSEPNLYSINNELKDASKLKDTQILSILGDATDENLMDRIFSKEKISIVFHSAAYKHVPLVELNPLQGLKNNILSTYVICSKSVKYKIEQMILISSDKAVRPTNIMGASKRFSELIVQAFDAEINKKNKTNAHFINTKLLMVRFGNVLDSSGSVVPLFRNQIANGGPITLTHKDIIRYFMTIEEATELVLQSASLSEGGDLFLLDMGNPVKILDLAKQMIFLSGLTIRDSENPNGDIEILITGLRPGEKLYEELLIDAKSIKTIHPQIFRAKESFIDPEILWPKIEELKKTLNAYKKNESLDIISHLVPDWKRGSK